MWREYPIEIMAQLQQVCTFFLNGIYFGIDLQDVQKIIRAGAVTRVPLAPLDICGLINLHGQIVTVIDLQRRLAMNDTKLRSVAAIAKEQLSYNVVVQTQDEMVSLQVDDIGDVLELTADSFESPPATLKGRVRELLKGAYKLQNGFLLILDTEKVLAVKSNQS